MHKTVTFRSEMMSVVHDLIEDEGLVCQQTTNIVTAISNHLLDYKEEGESLNPIVLYCQNFNELLDSFPASRMYEVGRAPLLDSSVRSILKKCAPLARGSWHIFVERIDGETLRYGVFFYLCLPSTLRLDEAITAFDGKFAVVVKYAGNKTVEIRGLKGSIINLSYTTARDDHPKESALLSFCGACCVAIKHPLAEDFAVYFAKLVSGIIAAAHGTILICMKKDSLQGLDELADRVNLDPPLNVFEHFCDYKQSESAESLLKLQGAEEILGGFIGSDGITIFDSSARVLAYRGFYKGPQAEAAAGGARSRAFEGVKGLIGPSIEAAFLASQDGTQLYVDAKS